ncbi:MAG: hypothetical protein HKN95_06620 [Acidimicrobiia bacterium]|nr:hypothetical protein [Acidimicrobiia bacterium]
MSTMRRPLIIIAALAIAGLAFSFTRIDSSGVGSVDRKVVESVQPAPGDLVPRQSVIEVDLETGYRAELWILANPASGTWLRIPESELSYVEGTGVYRWVPGPGKVVEEWTSGEHTIRVVWDTLTGLPDVGEYEWTFRTY